MKSVIGLLLISIIITTGCNKEKNNPALTESIDSLTFWWNWTVFGPTGRGMNFEFYGTKPLTESYKLKFAYTIKDRNILISLTDKVDNGKCNSIDPTWGSTCVPVGDLFIPDSLISVGNYSLTVRTPDFVTNCELLANGDSIQLKIPLKQHISSLISAVYPLPRNLLFGGIAWGVGGSKQQAQSFLDDLLSLGLTRTTLPDYPYYDLSVDKNGHILNRYASANDSTIEFLYTMHNNFRDIFNLAVKHFNNANLNIGMFSSNADEAFLDKIDGVSVFYAK